MCFWWCLPPLCNIRTKLCLETWPAHVNYRWAATHGYIRQQLGISDNSMVLLHTPYVEDRGCCAPDRRRPPELQLRPFYQSWRARSQESRHSSCQLPFFLWAAAACECSSSWYFSSVALIFDLALPKDPGDVARDPLET